MSDREKRPDNKVEPVGVSDSHGLRRPYTAPQILSVERLEAAAATCDPPTGGFGKTSVIDGGSCVTLGS